MATPSSSTTTPSPQPRYMQPAEAGHAPSPLAVAISPNEKEDRDKAIQKFLASAEIAKLTRGLRTRLSYASYKAAHNVAHNTLPDLEAQAQSSHVHAKLAASRIPGNYYNNPATQGNSAMTPNASSRAPQRKGPMAPPPPVTASATQSLFASILAPPPAKRARTIHNPQDPPVPASSKPATARSPARKTTKGRDPERGQVKSKTRSRGAKDKGKGKGKAQASHDAEESVADIDIDMTAAATLTNLLLHQRQQSQSVTASSPRSSVSAGSDSGSASTHGYQQFAQSSTRTVTDAAAVSSLPARPSTPSAESTARSEGNLTPKPTSRTLARTSTSGTPHPPTDSEAADLMLFLATSPSPVRPSHPLEKDASKGSFKVHALSSGFKGRALFPSALGDGTRTSSRPLRRDDTASFASTATVVEDETASGVSTVAERMGKLSTSPPPKPGRLDLTASGHLSVPMEPTVTPPTPTEPASSQPRLLPAPPSPSQAQSQRAASVETSSFPSSHPVYVPADANTVGSSPAHFNIHEYINASPSPAVGAPRDPSGYQVGRRLFEPHHGANGAAPPDDSPAGSQGGLAAGIDLTKDPKR